MTAKEYKAMILLECGEDITLETARNLMSIEREHDAEAIACGRDEVVPASTPIRSRHSESCAYGYGGDCNCGLFTGDDY